jgi:hypothetical protein
MGIDPKGPVRFFVLSVLILAAASGARPGLAAALEVGGSPTYLQRPAAPFHAGLSQPPAFEMQQAAERG